MNMEDACNLALKKLGLNEIPPYSSNLPRVMKQRMEFTSMGGQIMRTVKTTAKLEDFI